jgi:hypothetical protein
MRKKLEFLTPFVLSVLVGFVLSPATASSIVRRYHGAICKPYASTSTSFYSDGFGLRITSASASTFVCPIMSDSYQPHNQVTTLNAHGQKTSTQGSDLVTTCVKFWAANSNVCSNDIGTSSTGPWGLPVLLDAWVNTGADFPYLKVLLQPQSGLAGFFVVNP